MAERKPRYIGIQVCGNQNHDYAWPVDKEAYALPEHKKWTQDYCFVNDDGSPRQCDNVLKLINCCIKVKELGLKGSGYNMPHVCIKPKPWAFNPSSLKKSCFETIIRNIVKHDAKGETSAFALLIYDLPLELRLQFWSYGWEYEQVLFSFNLVSTWRILVT